MDFLTTFLINGFFSFTTFIGRDMKTNSGLANNAFLGQKLNPLTLVFGGILACMIFSQSHADVIEVPDTQLTMNDELSEDIHQTLYHLRYGHYLPAELDDEYSARTLDAYFELLDPNKLYFTQKDVDQFSPYSDKLDDLLKKRDAEVAFDIFKLFRTRINERTELALNLIDQDFDFTTNESINIDIDNIQWAKDTTEVEDRWHKRIKNDTLQQVMAETEMDEIRSNLVSRYQRQRDVTFQLKADEVFEWFMNAFARELGPHTQYMSHVTSENFRINMSLSLEGIGAALQTEQDYTVINRIIPGGPAELSGEIDPEDKIVAVGQDGEDKVNVIGWRLMDVVQMIRGDKGTVVSLDVIKNDSAPGTPPKTIKLTRDVIQLEDQAAKLTEVSIPEGDDSHLFSVISIPSFYSNSGIAGSGGAKYTATTHDVRNLLEEIEESDSEGLIIDLRGNGGGYLNEAISLTGLFIPQGPVVQVVQSNRKRQVLNDDDRTVAYDGPMVVLIDRYSASASEIFAAAMQDYGRALIIGERSFGKGTVQRVAPLRYGNNITHESTVKLTTAKFFRINGGSTQYEGVIPDVALNSGIEDEEFGERAYENALPWSQTDPASYDSSLFPSALVQDLNKEHLDRSEDSSAFIYLRQNSARIMENRNVKSLSLNINTRQQETDEQENLAITQLNAYRQSLGLESVTSETRSDNPLPGEDEHWNSVYHEEAARILLEQNSWTSNIIAKDTETLPAPAN